MKSIWKNCFIVFLLAVATVSIVSARQIKISPPWNIHVLDDHGMPVTNCNVSESWQFYGLSDEQREEKTTDSQGKVSFAARSISMSEVRYAASHATSLLKVHASFETSAHIDIFSKDFKGVLVYFDDNKLNLSDSGAEGGITNDAIDIIVRLRPFDLIDAVNSHNFALAKRLLAESPSTIKMRDSIGFTLLHSAMGSQPEDFEIAKLLIDAGADVNARANDGRTPLHQAAHDGAIQTMSLLISKGADVNAVIHNPIGISEDLYTPLHVALSWGGGDDETKIKMIDLLVKQGADVNAKARFNETPLCEAAFLSGSSVVQELLAKGADPSIRNTDGKLPLDMAKEFKKSENVKVVEDFSSKTK